MKTYLILSPAVLAFALAGCMSQDTRHEGPNSARAQDIQMNKMDLNRDGFLTPDEVKPDLRLSQDFFTYDTNGDGRISGAEFGEYVRANTQ